MPLLLLPLLPLWPAQPSTANSSYKLVSVSAACGFNTSIPGAYNITFRVAVRARSAVLAARML